MSILAELDVVGRAAPWAAGAALVDAGDTGLPPATGSGADVTAR